MITQKQNYIVMKYAQYYAKKMRDFEMPQDFYYWRTEGEGSDLEERE